MFTRVGGNSFWTRTWFLLPWFFNIGCWKIRALNYLNLIIAFINVDFLLIIRSLETLRNWWSSLLLNYCSLPRRFFGNLLLLIFFSKFAFRRVVSSPSVLSLWCIWNIVLSMGGSTTPILLSAWYYVDFPRTHACLLITLVIR